MLLLKVSPSLTKWIFFNREMLMTWKIREFFLLPNFKNFSKIIFSLRYFCTSFCNLNFSSNFEVYKKIDCTWWPLKLRLKVYDKSTWRSYNFKVILILMVIPGTCICCYSIWQSSAMAYLSGILYEYWCKCVICGKLLLRSFYTAKFCLVFLSWKWR